MTSFGLDRRCLKSKRLLRLGFTYLETASHYSLLLPAIDSSITAEVKKIAYLCIDAVTFEFAVDWGYCELVFTITGEPAMSGIAVGWSKVYLPNRFWSITYVGARF